jgi:hypothetical protein
MKLKNFKVYELVPQSIYEERGDRAIHLIDSRIITFLEMFREYTKSPITINDWYWGGRFDGRGFRDTDNPDYKKYSQHSNGRGIDFDVKGWTPDQVRQWIVKNKDLWWVRPITFVEDDVNWVHIDCRYSEDNSLILWSIKTRQSKVFKRD